MNEQERQAFNDLRKKVKQHEQTISELVKIIAATNRKIAELTLEQRENKAYLFK